MSHPSQNSGPGTVVRVLAELIYRSGLIRLLNRLVNRFELVRNDSGTTFPYLRRRNHRNIQILLYHRVNDESDSFLPSTPVATFRTHMEYLAENYRVWSLEQAVDALRKDEVPPNVAVVTFDDGYRDNYQNAFPVLDELSLPATIFLATGVIGTGRMLWHDRVLAAFSRTRLENLSGFAPIRERCSLATAAERWSVARRVLGCLKEMDDEQRAESIRGLVERLAVEDAAEREVDLMLSWSEVREMSARGISFGSHTVNHPILSRLRTEQARTEITRSKTEIEQQLDAPVSTFAYPNGRGADFTETTKALLREAGYICAVTTIFGTNRAGENGTATDLMELRRGGAWDNSRAAFAARMNLYKLY